MHLAIDASTDAQPFLDSLGAFGTVLAIKLYRMQLQRPAGVPVRSSTPITLKGLSP